MLIVVVLSAGATLLMLLVALRAEPEKRNVENTRLVVDAMTLTPQTVTEEIVGYGAARADRAGWVSAEVAGRIVELAPELLVGATVAAGDRLALIDDRSYRAEADRVAALLAADEAQLASLDVEQANVERLLAIAESELAIAEREYQRVLGLFEGEVSNRRELDLARGAYEAARRTDQQLRNQLALIPQRRAAAAASRAANSAALARARLDIERCVLDAPFDGRIEAVAVELGERVAPGERLVALLDPRWIEVPIELPVSQRSQIEVGASVHLLIEGAAAAGWTGTIARIAPSADLATRTFSAFVEVDNAAQPHDLLPGMFVQARVAGSTLRDVLLVPRGALDRGRVYLYVEGAARRREVAVRRTLLDRAVLDGLAPGDVLITSNLDALYDGLPVKLSGAPAVDDGLAGAPADEPATAAAEQPEAGT